MSLDREYEASYVGVTTAFTVPLNVGNSKQTVVRLVQQQANGAVKKASFAIRVLGATRIRQGGSSVDARETDASGQLKSMHLPASMRWRCDVRDTKTNHIAFMTASGAVTFLIEITRITDCDTDDLPTLIADGTK